MKHPNPYADFWLANTHAWTVEPGEEAQVFSSGEDALTRWATDDGTLLLVYTSTRNELVALHNASVGGADALRACDLPGWPWRILLDDLPPAASANRAPFAFPVKQQSDEAA